MTSNTTMGVLRPDGERLSVRFERRFAAPIERVWAALTEPEELSAWLMPAWIEAHVGGRARFDFDEDGYAEGSVLSFDPPTVLEYEWHYPGEDQSVVRWELTAEGEDTLLVLDHRLLAMDQATGYGAGWHAYLERLAARLGGDATTGAWDERFEAHLPRYREAAEAIG